MMMVMRKPLGESCHYLLSNIWIMLYELSVLFLSCSYPQFSSSEEAAAIEEILQAYDDGDEEAARRVLSLPLIKYMDNAV